MSILDIMTLEGQLLLMIAVGFLMAKLKVLDEAERLANILFYIILPCNTFNSFGKSYTMGILVQSAIVIAATTALEIASVFLPRLLLFRFPRKRGWS